MVDLCVVLFNFCVDFGSYVMNFCRFSHHYGTNELVDIFVMAASWVYAVSTVVETPFDPVIPYFR